MIMAADDLARQGARASAAMVLTWFSLYIPISTLVAYFTKDVNPLLKFNGGLAKLGSTALVK